MGFSILYSIHVDAQTCCSGGIPLSNSIGLPIESQGAWQLSLSYDYNRLNTLLSGSDQIDDDSRLRITQSLLFNSGYTITNDLSVELLLTYINQKREIDQFGNINIDETYGIGDAVLLFKYNFNDLLDFPEDLELTNGVSHISYFVDPYPDPIPEPATMLIFGVGLAGLAGTRLRRKK